MNIDFYCLLQWSTHLMCRLLPRKVLSSYYQRVSESEKDGENEREG